MRFSNRSRFSAALTQTLVIILIFRIVGTEAFEWVVSSNYSFAEAIRNLTFGDTVIVGGGIYLSCNHVITASNITIQALPYVKVIIDCNRSGSHLLIYGNHVRVQGITFVNGFSNLVGGCVQVYAKGVVFQDCRFELCTSSFGGGIFLSSAAGNVTLINLEVLGCRAGFGGGLGVDNMVRVLIRGRLKLEANTVSGSGGGIYLAPRSVVEVDVQTSVIRGNRATGFGGGVYLESAYISISGEISFVNNSAMNAGALHSEASLVKFESGSTVNFVQNSCGQNGGAVFLRGGSALYSGSSVRFEGIVFIFALNLQ
jgi:predicted outer membrane repeat protein